MRPNKQTKKWQMGAGDQRKVGLNLTKENQSILMNKTTIPAVKKKKSSF